MVQYLGRRLVLQNGVNSPFPREFTLPVSFKTWWIILIFNENKRAKSNKRYYVCLPVQDTFGDIGRIWQLLSKISSEGGK